MITTIHMKCKPKESEDDFLKRVAVFRKMIQKKYHAPATFQLIWDYGKRKYVEAIIYFPHKEKTK